MPQNILTSITVRDDGSVVLDKFFKDAKLGLKGLETDSKAAGAASQDLLEKIKSMSGGFTAAGVAMGAFAAGGALALKDATSRAIEFDAEMANVNSILDTTGGTTIDNLRGKIMQLSPALGSVTELSKGLYEAISAGVEPAKSIEFVGEAAMLAKAGLASTQSAVDVLTTSLNAYKGQNLTAAAASDALMLAVNKGKTTLPELAASLGQVIPTAATLGISFNDLNAMLAELTLVGLDTASSTVSLNAAFTNLISPSAEAKKMAKDLGINLGQLRDMVSKPGGLVEALKILAEKTHGSDEAMTTFFNNQRAGRAVLNMTNQGLDQVKTRVVQFDESVKKGGITLDTFTKQQESAQAHLDTMKNAMDRAKVAITTGLEPALKFGADQVTALANALVNVDPATRTAVASVGATATAMAGMGGAAALMLGQIPNVISGFKALQVPIGGVGGSLKGLAAFLTSPWGIAIGVAVAALAAFEIALGAWNRKIDESTAKAHEFIAAQKGIESGGFGAATQAIKTQQATLDAWRQNMDRSVESLTKAEAEQKKFSGVFGDTAAYERATADVAKYRGEVDHFQEKVNTASHKLDAMKKAAEEEAKAHAGATTPTKNHGDAEGELDEKARAAAKAVDDLRAKVAGNAVEQAQAALAAANATTQQEAYARVVQALGKEYDANISKAAAVAAGMKDQAKAADYMGLATVEAGQQFQKGMDTAAKAIGSADKQMQSFGGVVKETTTWVKINGQAHEVTASQLDLLNRAAADGVVTQAELDRALKGVDRSQTSFDVTMKEATQTVTVAGEQVQVTAEQLRALQDASADGSLTVDELKSVLGKLPPALAESAKQAAELTQTFERFKDSAADAMADATTSIITNLGDLSKAKDIIFGSLKGAFADAINRLLKSQLFDPLIDGLFSQLGDGLKSSFPGLGSIFGAGLSSVFKTGAAAVPDELGPAIAGIGTNAGVTQTALSAGGQVGTAATTGFAATLTAAAPYALAAVAAGAVIYGTITTSKMGPEAKAAIITALAGPIAGGLLWAFGVLDGPDMRKRIALEVQKTITHALQDTDYQKAIAAGLEPMGFELNQQLLHVLSDASRSNDLLRSQAEKLAEEYGADFMAGFSPAFIESVNKHGASSTSVPTSDWVRAFFPTADDAAQAYAVELSKSLASVQVAAMGLTGSDALVYTENLSAGFVNLAQSTGMSIEEFTKWLETSNAAAGMSTQFFASLDAANAALIEQAGPNGAAGVMQDLNAQLSKAFGVKVDAGNLVDAFIESGASADAFVKQLDRAAETNPELRELLKTIEPGLVDALTSAGDAAEETFGTIAQGAARSMAEIAADIERFNLSTYGALVQQQADIEQKLQNAEGDARESLQRELDAVTAKIETMAGKVDILTRQMADSFESMWSKASEDGSLSLQEMQALLAAYDQAIASGILTPETAAQFQEVLDNMELMANESIDQIRKDVANGQLPPLVPPPDPAATAGLDAAAETSGEVADNTGTAAENTGTTASNMDAAAQASTAMVQQLSAINATMNELLQTMKPVGDAFRSIAGDSASVTTDLGNLGTALAQSNAAAAGLSTISASLAVGGDAAQAMAAAVGEVPPQADAITEALATLATQAGLTSSTVKAALGDVIGEVDDKASTSAVHAELEELVRFLGDDATRAFEDWSLNAIHSVSAVYTTVGDLQSALNGLAGTYTVTVIEEHVVKGGPGPGPGPGPGDGSGDGSGGGSDGGSTGGTGTGSGDGSTGDGTSGGSTARVIVSTPGSYVSTATAPTVSPVVVVGGGPSASAIADAVAARVVGALTDAGASRLLRVDVASDRALEAAVAGATKETLRDLTGRRALSVQRDGSIALKGLT